MTENLMRIEQTLEYIKKYAQIAHAANLAGVAKEGLAALDKHIEDRRATRGTTVRLAPFDWQEVENTENLVVETPVGHYRINYWEIDGNIPFWTAYVNGMIQLEDSVGNRKLTFDGAVEACYQDAAKKIQSMIGSVK